MSTFADNDAHERARRLIALAGPEALLPADQTWLAAHVEACGSCRAFAENARETIHALRAIPIAARRSLVSTTQMRVRRRALELRRRRERLWLVSLSCFTVTLSAAFTTAVMWWGFAWLGERTHLASSVWEVAFLVVCLMPALVVGIFLLARETQLSDHTGTYVG